MLSGPKQTRVVIESCRPGQVSGTGWATHWRPRAWARRPGAAGHPTGAVHPSGPEMGARPPPHARSPLRSCGETCSTRPAGWPGGSWSRGPIARRHVRTFRARLWRVLERRSQRARSQGCSLPMRHPGMRPGLARVGAGRGRGVGPGGPEPPSARWPPGADRVVQRGEACRGYPGRAPARHPSHRTGDGPHPLRPGARAWPQWRIARTRGVRDRVRAALPARNPRISIAGQALGVRGAFTLRLA